MQTYFSHLQLILYDGMRGNPWASAIPPFQAPSKQAVSTNANFHRTKAMPHTRTTSHTLVSSAATSRSPLLPKLALNIRLRHAEE